MARIKKASLVDQIYSRLREDIITLKIPMGTRLNVNELQEELVIYENNVGARVLTLDEHDVREIHELALTLQQAAVQLSMKNGNLDEMLDAVEEQLDRYKSARSPREGVKAVHNLIGVFYHHCGNRRLDRSMVAIQGQMLLLRHIYAECPGWSGHAAELTALRDGVEDEDARAVCAALQSYMEQSTPAILKWLKEHE